MGARIQQSNRASVEGYYKDAIQNNKMGAYANNNKKYQIIKSKVEFHLSQSNLSSRWTEEEKQSIILKIMRLYDVNGRLINPKGIEQIKIQGMRTAEIRQIIGLGEEQQKQAKAPIKDEFIPQHVLQEDDITTKSTMVGHKYINSQEDRETEIKAFHRFEAGYFTAIYNSINNNYWNLKQRFLIAYKNFNLFKVSALCGILILIFMVLYFLIAQ